jgi:hypothetical protein
VVVTGAGAAEAGVTVEAVALVMARSVMPVTTMVKLAIGSVNVGPSRRRRPIRPKMSSHHFC